MPHDLALRGLPTQPPGYGVQAVWHRQHGFVSYDFFYVYDPQGRLDFGRSFWVATPLTRGDDPPVRWVSWRRHQLVASQPGRFTDFASPSAPSPVIDRWLDEGPPTVSATHRPHAASASYRATS